jgi:hypothetical protein
LKHWEQKQGANLDQSAKHGHVSETVDLSNQNIWIYRGKQYPFAPWKMMSAIFCPQKAACETQLVGGDWNHGIL